MLLRHNGTERIGRVRFFGLHAHHAPVRLASRKVEPADRSVTDTEIRLHVAFFTRADRDVACKDGRVLNPGERLMVGRSQAPSPRPGEVAVRREPAVYESGDVFRVRSFRQEALQVGRRADDSRTRVPGMDVPRTLELHLLEEIAVPSDPIAE